MVEETANQPTNPADEEYEYEYIELAEEIGRAHV